MCFWFHSGSEKVILLFSIFSFLFAWMVVDVVKMVFRIVFVWSVSFFLFIIVIYIFG